MANAQEEQWTTHGELRRALAWQQHRQGEWVIEAYATAELLPQAPESAADAACARLLTANRCPWSMRAPRHALCVLVGVWHAHLQADEQHCNGLLLRLARAVIL
jgi:hypothetical protein